jgi:hypothetical protein
MIDPPLEQHGSMVFVGVQNFEPLPSQGEEIDLVVFKID